MYLGVYKRNRYYYYLYTYVGRPVRWLEHRAWGRALVNSTLLPVYYLVHLLKSRGQRTACRDRLSILQRRDQLIRVVLTADDVVKAVVPERHNVVRQLFTSLLAGEFVQKSQHAVDVIVVEVTHHQHPD